jgi:tetratricopeptide (TPR) repeat protein
MNALLLTLFLFNENLHSHERISCESLLSLSIESTQRSEVKELMQTAVQLYNKGYIQSAKKKLEKILAQNPNDYRAMAMLSKITYQQGKLLEALEYQKRVIQLEPSHRNTSYFSLAQILLALGRGSEALENLEIVLSTDPQHTAALGLKAKYLLSINELGDAYATIVFKSEIDRKNDLPISYSEALFAEYYIKKGFLDQALKRANNLIASHRPRKHQVKVPKPYLVGLSLKSKILILKGTREDVNDALKVLETLEGYFESTPAWILRLKVEALFRIGKTVLAKKTLIEIIQSSNSTNIIALADLVRIEDKDNPLLPIIFKSLSDTEARLVIEISNSTSWDYLPDESIEAIGPSIKNNFWFGLNNFPINNFTRKSTF